MLSSKEYISLILNIDEKIETINRALYPRINNVPQKCTLPDDEFFRFYALKEELKAHRAETAKCVRLAAEKHKERKRRKEMEENARAYFAAKSLVDTDDSLRC